MPNESHPKYSKAHSNCFLAEIQSHLIEKILGQFQIVAQPNSNRISSKKTSANSKLCLSQIPMHLDEKIPGKLQIVSQPISNSLSSKYF